MRITMNLELNPKEVDEEYLRCINACFPNWGDTRTSDWAFRRRLGPEPPPDRFVLREAGEVLAGSAVNYRRVLLPNGNGIIAGIMTGSWTLPASRGRGCFTRVIEESARITADRSGALLLAFVTETNPSCRQLQKAGAMLFPTSYFVAAGRPARPGETSPLLRQDDTHLESLVEQWHKRREPSNRFAYDSFSDWYSQFVGRPWKTSLVRTPRGSFAVIESYDSTDRVNAFFDADDPGGRSLLVALLDRASAARRKLFLFSTAPEVSAVCKELGFEEKPGYLTAMITDWQKLGEALLVPKSDSNPDNLRLGDPASPWHLHQWDLQAGDRM